MKELQFESASWIHEAIQEMLDATKTMRAPVVRTREQQEQKELNEEIEDTDGTKQDEVKNECPHDRRIDGLRIGNECE